MLGYEQTPGFQYALNTGLDAVKRKFAAGGMGNSGNAMNELLKTGIGMADQNYNTWADRNLQQDTANKNYNLGMFNAQGNLGLGMYKAGNDFTLGQQSNANNALGSWYNYDLGKERNGLNAADMQNRYNIDNANNDVNWWNADTNRGNAMGNLLLRYRQMVGPYGSSFNGGGMY